jgi:hypothetical protein
VQKTKSGYRVILDAGFVCILAQKENRTGGYSVLRSDRHNGGDGFISAAYAYDEGEYRMTDCSLARFNADPIRQKLSFCEPMF